MDGWTLLNRALLMRDFLVLYDLLEGFGIQTCSTNQRAVNFFF